MKSKDSNQTKPLNGLKVIELHAIGPVPFAGMLLQNLGAQVTRIAPPNDPGLGITVKPEFDVLNVGKTVLQLDLKSPTGKSQLIELLKQSDVLMEGFRPGVLERIGFAPPQLLEAAPRLVIGRLSGWGNKGALAARAGHDINYLALSGALHAMGTAQQPIPPLNLVADFGGGAMHLVVGILAKLVQRGIDPQQKGGLVTTSILAGTHGLTPMFYGLIAAELHNLQRESNLLDGGRPFYRVYACKAAKNYPQFVALGALEPKFYAELVQLLGLRNLVDVREQYNPDHWDRTRELFTQVIAQKTRDEWASLASEVDCCLSPVLTFSESQTHPHNVANQWFDATKPVNAPHQIIQFS